jgi:hypothetical protein
VRTRAANGVRIGLDVLRQITSFAVAHTHAEEWRDQSGAYSEHKTQNAVRFGEPAECAPTEETCVQGYGQRRASAFRRHPGIVSVNARGLGHLNPDSNLAAAAVYGNSLVGLNDGKLALELLDAQG